MLDGADTIHTTTRTFRRTATRPGTTRTPVRTAGALASMARTAALASALGTTREPGRTRAARRPTVPTARGALPRRTIRAPVHTRRRARDPTCTAVGDRPRYSAATTGPKPIATRTGRREPRRARSGPT